MSEQTEEPERGDPLHLVVMGVSGTGKSTIAAGLERRLGWRFLEGDSLHSEDNVDKMAAGIPLTDDDRSPWLEALAAWSAEQHRQGESTVLTCSALRRSYRRTLTRDTPGTYFVHLVGDPALVLERMQTRSAGGEHFMPARLLESQLDTLEPLGPDEAGGTFDVADEPDVIVEDVLADLGLSDR